MVLALVQVLLLLVVVMVAVVMVVAMLILGSFAMASPWVIGRPAERRTRGSTFGRRPADRRTIVSTRGGRPAERRTRAPRSVERTMFTFGRRQNESWFRDAANLATDQAVCRKVNDTVTLEAVALTVD